MQRKPGVIPETASARIDTNRVNESAIDPPVFVASDSYPLRYRLWPAAESCGAILALHGIQSHSGWYEFSSTCFAAGGFDVWFCDRRGSGQNALQRGHAVHADRLVNDVVQFLTFVRAQTAPRPVLLMGISWGGKLATVVADRRPDLLDGLVLMSPGLVPKVQPSRWQQLQLWAASHLVGSLNHRMVPVPLNDPALFTDSARFRQFIAQDKLAIHEVNVPFLLANRALDQELHDIQLQSLTMPSLLALAEQDAIIHNRATRRLFERITINGQVMEFAQAQHSLEFAADRKQIFDRVLNWLQQTALTTRQQNRRPE